MNGKFGCFVFLLLLAGLGVGGYLYMDQIMDRVLEFTEPKVTKDVERRIFETTEFVRSLENLELAERWTRETVKETDTVRVQLPFLEQELVSNASYEVRFSVIYTYVVSARRDDWRFKLLGDVLYVQAPQIECRPPAIDTGSIEARFDEGLLVLEEEKRLEEIKRSLTAIANERAVDSAHIELVREECRATLQEHIFNWFFKDRFEISVINIRFADEKPFPVFRVEDEIEGKKYEFDQPGN